MSSSPLHAGQPPVMEHSDTAMRGSPPMCTQCLVRQPQTLRHAANRPDDDSDPSHLCFLCRDGRSLPRYTDHSADLPDGLYLGLFNGRNDPFASPFVARFDGPLIGRLRDCQTVQAREVKLEFLDPFEGRWFFPNMENVAARDGDVPTGKITLPIQQVRNAGAIVFDGRYFADWTVFIISPVRTPIGRDLR